MSAKYLQCLLITRFHVVKVPRSRFTKFELWNAAQSTTSSFQLAISVSHICTCMNGSQWNENCSVTTPLANLLSTRLGLLVVWSPGWQVWVPNYLCMPIIPPSCWPQTKPFLRHPQLSTTVPKTKTDVRKSMSYSHKPNKNLRGVHSCFYLGLKCTSSILWTKTWQS